MRECGDEAGSGQVDTKGTTDAVLSAVEGFHGFHRLCRLTGILAGGSGNAISREIPFLVHEIRFTPAHKGLHASQRRC